jgi:hypothetical protein
MRAEQYRAKAPECAQHAKAARDPEAKRLGNIKTLVIVFTLLTISASASAENCFVINGEYSITATLSGRITNAVQFPARLRNSEGRAAEGPYLALDTPLLVDAGLGCTG